MSPSPFTKGGMTFPRARFTAESAELAEKAVMREVYPRVAAAIECILAEGIAAAMNKYN